MMSFISEYLKYFFLMTPFFVLSMFIAMTTGWPVKERRHLAVQVTTAILVITVCILFFGRWIFSIFGITVDSFRIGGGIILFLSAVGLVNSNVQDKTHVSGEMPTSMTKLSNIAVVPLAIPVTVGPATIAMLLISGAEAKSILHMVYCSGALAFAALSLGVILFLSTIFDKMGKEILIVLSKLTGLILAAMASQMVFTGIRSLMTKS